MSSPESLSSALEEVRLRERERQVASQEAAQRHLSWVAAIKVAAALGVSKSDIARAAGVSPQRVHQVLGEHD